VKKEQSELVQSSGTLNIFNGIGAISSSSRLKVCWAGTSAVFGLIFAAATGRLGTPKDSFEQISAAMQVVHFLLLFFLMLTVPDSYRLASVLGRSAAFSGMTTGIYMGGVGIGGVLMFFIMKLPGFQPVRWMKAVLLTSVFICILGSVAYAIVAFLASNQLAPKEAYVLSILLVASRLFFGFGAGLAWQQLYVGYKYVVGDHLESTMLIVVVAGMIAQALAPATGAIIDNFADSTQQPFRGVAVAGVALTTSCWLCLCLTLPSSIVVPQVTEKGTGESIPITPARRRCLILACMTISTVRAFVTAGVEVASVYLLEVKYSVGLPWPGILTGIAFVFLALRTSILPKTEGKFNAGTQWEFRRLLGLCVFGCLLLFGGPESMGSSGSTCLLLLGDLLVAGVCVLEGKILAVQMKYAFPPGESWLDLDGATIIWQITTSLARFLGPWVARHLVESHSQAAYAALQLGLVLFTWLVFEGVAAPLTAIDEK